MNKRQLRQADELQRAFGMAGLFIRRLMPSIPWYITSHSEQHFVELDIAISTRDEYWDTAHVFGRSPKHFGQEYEVKRGRFRAMIYVLSPQEQEAIREAAINDDLGILDHGLPKLPREVDLSVDREQSAPFDTDSSDGWDAPPQSL